MKIRRISCMFAEMWHPYGPCRLGEPTCEGCRKYAFDLDCVIAGGLIAALAVWWLS